MEIVRALSAEGGLITLRIQAIFNAGETRMIERFKMRNYRIQTRDGPFAGKNAISLNMKSAFRSQISKVKNRWSAALIRTTGFTVLDLLLLLFHAIWIVIRAVLRIFFGRRKRLSTVINGITIKSRKVEQIKEAEFFILVSLAAVAKAIAYADTLDQEHLHIGPTLFSEIEGLDFAGAGNINEGEFDEISNAASMLSKVE